MARTAVYRSVGSKRRTTVPRSTGTSTGLSTAFGRMLAKLTLASNTLHSARPRRRR